MRLKKPVLVGFGLLAGAFIFAASLILWSPETPKSGTPDGLLSTGKAGAAVPVGPEPPGEVQLFRHAEEPKNGPDLDDRGLARANALAGLFQHPVTYPSAIFAAKSSKQSARPVQTCEPIAKAVGVSINSDFDEREFKELATKILQGQLPAGSIVVVCWKRETMSQLAAALGVANPPAEWPGDQYDHVWRITYSNGKATLKDEPQGIRLPGDVK